MGGAAQAMKRIPRIKFPQRHPKPSGSESEIQAPAKDGNATQTFFLGLKASTTLGGKASLQPKRTLVSNEEIEAILVCKTFLKICEFLLGAAFSPCGLSTYEQS
ncbi:hypothetical protein TIFTF001_003319 [Ficus carica]|uniref:Uncharacterized protein n=1 Tax=Ficus carica TaxID=3494 RepID=A0AA88DA50_FICCA|nr:hypothetical protein TIFTF001_003319 [Ficus carica]